MGFRVTDMSLKRIDDDTLFAALVERDPTYDGIAFVGVSTTGVFCRLTCPARKPKRENCSFFLSVADCEAAGFRACRRCHPRGPEADALPIIKTLQDALARAPQKRWREVDVRALGVDPSTARRAFKKHFGMTFLAYARIGRVESGFSKLSAGDRAIDAQLDAGYASASGFRRAFANLLGIAPGQLAKDASLRVEWLDTPLGAMVAVTDDDGLYLLEFVDRRALPTELRRLHKKRPIAIGKTKTSPQLRRELAAYFAGRSSTFTVPLHLEGSAFSQRVWAELRRTDVGTTCSYAELARRIDRPSAFRAVARANGANQIAIIVPCHRIIGSDGSLTGYGGGLWRKQKLIDLEKRMSAAEVHSASRDASCSSAHIVV